MKRQYITPSLFCVKLDTRRAFLEGSMHISNEVITNEDDAGFVKEYTPSDNSVWDNEW